MSEGFSITHTIHIAVLFVLSLFVYDFLNFDGVHLVPSEAKAIPLEGDMENSNPDVLKINGESYGSNGARFTTFAECFSEHNNSTTKFFSGGSNLTISATLQKNHSSSEFHADGFWQLNLYSYGEVLVKNGTFYSGKILPESKGDHIDFLLYGIKYTDRVCGDEPRFITIKATCSEFSPLYYTEKDGDRIGSETPLKYEKIYHLFTHMIECTLI